MIQDFFTPVSDKICNTNGVEKELCEKKIKIHTQKSGFPDLEHVQIAFFDVREGRAAVNNLETAIGANEVRTSFYKLCWGNWKISVADLGSISQGNSIKDTYYALQETIAFLVKKQIIPIVLGGGQDLIYANYRGYNQLDQAVNLAVASPKFNFGSLETDLDSSSYLSKIILEEPCNLFNYTNLGFQTFYNTQEEISLIETLNFEAYRLGDITDISIAEPVMRDADIVAIDLGVIKASVAPANGNANPNGLDGDAICALARYAGISDKVTSFGVYEFNSLLDVNYQTSKLISQILWYFLEGFSLRTNDYPFGSKDDYLKYIVPFDGNFIHFYQSNKSQRWWMQLEISVQKKYQRHVLIPCSYEDYIDAIAQKMPERWYNVQKKLTQI